MASVVDVQRLRRPAAFVLQTLTVAAAYFGAGRLGLLRGLTVEGAVVTPLWPSTGVALACLLVFGIWVWPGIALGVLFVVMSLSPVQFAVIGTVFGNTAAPVCGYLMLRRVGFRTDLGRLRDGLALVFLAALTATLISATIGVGLLVLTGQLAADGFWRVWPAWWVGDAMGVLIVTPLLLVLMEARRPPRLTRWKEAVALTVATCVIVPVATLSSVSLLFLVYPLLIWAALSFQLVGSMLCALDASVMATVTATDRTGAFENMSSMTVMLKLQAFNGSMALTALLLSALITEQRNTRRSVEQACLELAEVLEHLTAGEAPPPGAPTAVDGEHSAGQRRADLRGP
ncbi:MASE1 domain-containing protein [Streptomyces sp. NPDC047000]|uniref:MASE1 domain-containing protein n=1 Tax=Streptomyces sp. NPDC047000 TaxID=3155474 RepID=UPI0033E9DA50